MKYTGYVTFRCPYCGTQNKVLADLLQKGKNFLYCDLAQGGCEEELVVDVELSASTRVFGLVPASKIIHDGEEADDE